MAIVNHFPGGAIDIPTDATPFLIYSSTYESHVPKVYLSGGAWCVWITEEIIRVHSKIKLLKDARITLQIAKGTPYIDGFAGKTYGFLSYGSDTNASFYLYDEDTSTVLIDGTRKNSDALSDSNPALKIS